MKVGDLVRYIPRRTLHLVTRVFRNRSYCNSAVTLTGFPVGEYFNTCDIEIISERL
jgi:hypothetical protein